MLNRKVRVKNPQLLIAENRYPTFKKNNVDKKLTDKFINVINYNSVIEGNESAGLKNISLDLHFELEKTKAVKISIFINTQDFYNQKSKKVVYKHQTYFERKNHFSLSKDELIKMFYYTQNQFLTTKMNGLDGQLVDIKTFFCLPNQLGRDQFLDVIQDVIGNRNQV